MPVPAHHPIRLGVNIDHVATVRNARGVRHPDPLKAAEIAIAAGADGITAHLREDRRHIVDDDIARLKARISKPLNLEMAATPEMIEIARRVRPHAACVVPERRQERTTEGGLDAAGQREALHGAVARLADAGIRVSLFIAAAPAQIEAAAAIGAPVIEIHTGAWCDAVTAGDAAAGRQRHSPQDDAGGYDELCKPELGAKAPERGPESPQARIHPAAHVALVVPDADQRPARGTHHRPRRSPIEHP